MRDEGARDEPWVETRAGGWFFLNAVLVAPELTVLVPLVAGTLLRAAGVLEGPSRFIDPVPAVAAYMLPRIGWLLVVPIWTTIHNLRMEGVERRARLALSVMLALHLAFFGYTLGRWLQAAGVL